MKANRAPQLHCLAHLVHEALAKVTQANHNEANSQKTEKHASARESVSKDGVRTDDGLQDGHQHEHGHHREEVTSPILPLLGHLRERTVSGSEYGLRMTLGSC